MPTLTPTKIEKYKPTKAMEVLSDGNGLSIRYRKNQSGAVSLNWMYSYKLGTTSNYITLGEYDTTLSDFDAEIYNLPIGTKLTLSNARIIALSIKMRRNQGIEPKKYIQNEIDRRALAKQQAVEDALAEVAAKIILNEKIKQENLSIRNMFDVWIEDGVRRKDGNDVLNRTFKKDVFPLIGDFPVKDVTEHDLRALLKAIAARGADRTAVLMRNSLTQMFAWAEKRQPWRKLMAEGNPMDLIEIEKIVSRDYDMDNRRTRRLSAEEIVELSEIFKKKQIAYDIAPNKRSVEHPVGKVLQCAIWIQLSTICRGGEMQMARWEHINFEKAEWYIPVENVKNNVSELMVYLSPFALEQFRLLHSLTGDTEWCFPARNKENAHVCIKSMSKQVGDRQSMFKKSKDGSPRSPMKNRKYDNSFVLGGGKDGAWTPHDLRRTGASMMQALRINKDVINKCQNHILEGSSKTDRHYFLHEFQDEKKVAWNLLGEHLALILKVSMTS
jgi:integrase